MILLLFRTTTTTIRTRLFSTVVQSGAATIFSQTIQPGTNVVDAYQQLTHDGILSKDEQQHSIIQQLQLIQDSLKQDTITTKEAEEEDANKEKEESSSWFGNLFGSNNETTTSTKKPLASIPKGAYLWGGPGCGKSLCMDLFYHCIDELEHNKRRIHFNDFMLDIHQRLHQLKQQQTDNNHDDIVPRLVNELVPSSSPLTVLCLDEMQITDIADAMMIKRVMGEMFVSTPIVCIMTSNRPPCDLYQNGLQRELFLPFIDQLQQHCHVLDMTASSTDYRMLTTSADTEDGSSSARKTYYIMNNDNNGNNSNLQSELEDCIQTLTKSETMQPTSVQTRTGRLVQVPRAAHGVARFDFDQLCSGKPPMGAEDFRVLARAFSTIVVENIPQMYHHVHFNEARRFIQFIDQMYEHKTNLIASAVVPPEELYVAQESDASSNFQRDEQFAFDRCLSRLNEMQSHEYITAPHMEAIVQEEEEDYLRLEVVKLSSADLQQLFQKYDVDKNDILDRNEIRQLLQDITYERDGHANVEDEWVDSIFTMMDTDDSGGIDWEEFQSYCSQHGSGIDRKVEYMTTSFSEPNPIV